MKKYNNNYYYKNYYSNNNNNNQEIEIDISNLKYFLNIKNKYSFKDIKNYYEKLKNNSELKRPLFFDEKLTDILSNSPKDIVSLDELIECNEKSKPKDTSSGKKDITDKTNNTNLNVKIPKMNPLSGMNKNFNKFDIVPGNAMSGLMMPFQPSPSIEESNKE